MGREPKRDEDGTRKIERENRARQGRTKGDYFAPSPLLVDMCV